MLFFVVPSGILFFVGVYLLFTESYERWEAFFSCTALGILLAVVVGMIGNAISSNVGARAHHFHTVPLVKLSDGHYADLTSVNNDTRYNMIVRQANGSIAYESQEVDNIVFKATAPHITCDSRYHDSNLYWRIWDDAGYGSTNCTLFVQKGQVG